jgi:hypothetical protein
MKINDGDECLQPVRGNCWSDKWSKSELPILFLQSHFLAILAVPLSEIVGIKLPQQLNLSD